MNRYTVTCCTLFTLIMFGTSHPLKSYENRFYELYVTCMTQILLHTPLLHLYYTVFVLSLRIRLKKRSFLEVQKFLSYLSSPTYWWRNPANHFTFLSLPPFPLITYRLYPIHTLLIASNNGLLSIVSLLTGICLLCQRAEHGGKCIVLFKIFFGNFKKIKGGRGIINGSSKVREYHRKSNWT